MLAMLQVNINIANSKNQQTSMSMAMSGLYVSALKRHFMVSRHTVPAGVWWSHLRTTRIATTFLPTNW
jgi:hypothetical protein